MHYVVHHQADRHDQLWSDRSMKRPPQERPRSKPRRAAPVPTETEKSFGQGHTIVSSNNTKGRLIDTVAETDAASIIRITISSSNCRLAGSRRQIGHNTRRHAGLFFPGFPPTKTEVELQYRAHRIFNRTKTLLTHSPMTVIAFTWSPQWCTKPRSSMSITACEGHFPENTNPRRKQHTNRRGGSIKTPPTL